MPLGQGLIESTSNALSYVGAKIWGTPGNSPVSAKEELAAQLYENSNLGGTGVTNPKLLPKHQREAMHARARKLAEWRDNPKTQEQYEGRVAKRQTSFSPDCDQVGEFKSTSGCLRYNCTEVRSLNQNCIQSGGPLPDGGLRGSIALQGDGSAAGGGIVGPENQCVFNPQTRNLHNPLRINQSPSCAAYRLTAQANTIRNHPYFNFQYGPDQSQHVTEQAASCQRLVDYCYPAPSSSSAVNSSRMPSSSAQRSSLPIPSSSPVVSSTPIPSSTPMLSSTPAPSSSLAPSSTPTPTPSFASSSSLAGQTSSLAPAASKVEMTFTPTPTPFNETDIDDGSGSGFSNDSNETNEVGQTSTPVILKTLDVLTPQVTQTPYIDDDGDEFFDAPEIPLVPILAGGIPAAAIGVGSVATLAGMAIYMKNKRRKDFSPPVLPPAGVELQSTATQISVKSLEEATAV